LLSATLLAALLGAPAAAGAARPGVPRCALGRLPAPLRPVIPRKIVSEEARFARSLSVLGAVKRRRAREDFSAGVAAYLYGMPTVVLRRTVERFPPNALIGIGGILERASYRQTNKK
jgi:hypothetical protein